MRGAARAARRRGRAAAAMAAAPEPYLPRYRIVADQAGSWDQAALRDTIHAQGYAIIRLGTADTRAIQDAAEAGAAFHDLPTNIKARTTLLVDEAAAGAAANGKKGLAGFNRVSAAKDVFRIRRENPGFEGLQVEKAAEQPEQPEQPAKKRRRTADTPVPSSAPWPAETALPGFRTAVEKGWRVLERLLQRCAASLLGDTEYRMWWQQRCLMRATQQWSSAPLDLFRYPNDTFATSTVNCFDHKDPGVLTAIPCAVEAGLMVRNHGSEVDASAQAGRRGVAITRWIDIEAIPDAIPYRDVCVFAGVELEKLTSGRLKATVHGVRKANKPRTSIVFELRPEEH
jgi:isopenicillin N synthase-like dioxygenase